MQNNDDYKPNDYDKRFSQRFARKEVGILEKETEPVIDWMFVSPKFVILKS